MKISLSQQPSKSVIASFLAGLMVLGAISCAAATEPSVSGLWQKIDEKTGEPVGWFLFVEHNGPFRSERWPCRRPQPRKFSATPCAIT